MRNLLRLNLRALHVGTAQLRMHAWLRGLRSTIGNTNARCVLDETAKVYLVANSAGEGGGLRLWATLWRQVWATLRLQLHV